MTDTSPMSFDPNGYSFDDFPALEPLELIANDLDINLTLFGGAASRAIMHKFAGSPDEKATLFDLAPFSSDFDLSHDGDKVITKHLKDLIADSIPFADWFRWSVLDAEKSRAAHAARAKSTNVPLRRIEIGNRRNSRIPRQAIMDIGNHVVSVHRNPSYEKNAFARSGRDVEFFGLMLALNALLDMREIFGQGRLEIGAIDEDGWLSTKALVRQLSLFEENPRLAARFWSMFANLAARAGSELILEFPALSSVIKVASGLPQMSNLLQTPFSPGRGLATSRFTDAGVLRVPEQTPRVFTGIEALEFTSRFLTLLPIARQPGGDAAPVRVDPAFELIAAVPEIELKPFGSPNSKRDDYDPYYTAADEEFLDIAWIPDPKQPLNPKGITACMIPYPDAFSIQYTFDVPAVGGVFPSNRPWVRIRLDDLIQHGRNGKATKVAVLILQAPLEAIP
jgi:hypothetical protein